jgi:hypothetical protein
VTVWKVGGSGSCPRSETGSYITALSRAERSELEGSDRELHVWLSWAASYARLPRLSRRHHSQVLLVSSHRPDKRDQPASHTGEQAAPLQITRSGRGRGLTLREAGYLGMASVWRPCILPRQSCLGLFHNLLHGGTDRGRAGQRHNVQPRTGQTRTWQLGMG